MRGLHDYFQGSKVNLLNHYWQTQKRTKWAKRVNGEWHYRVSETGPFKYTRDQIDFGHKLDVVVFDKVVSAIETELYLKVFKGGLSIERADAIAKQCKDLFMSNPKNYLPELKGVNRGNGGLIDLKYHETVEPLEALGRMLDTKTNLGLNHISDFDADAFEVLDELIGTYRRTIPELADSLALKEIQDLVPRPLPQPVLLSSSRMTTETGITAK